MARGNASAVRVALLFLLLFVVAPASHRHLRAMFRKPQDRVPSQPLPQDKKDYLPTHLQYLGELQTLKQKNYEALDLAIFGDSVTAFFRTENAGPWEALVASKYRAAVFSIRSDTTMNLLWRLQNQGGPRGLNVKVVMVLIGGNDLGRLALEYRRCLLLCMPLEDAARAVFRGVRRVLDEVAAQAPGAKLVALGLLPVQGGAAHGYPAQVDIRLQRLADATNALIKEYAGQRGVQYDDCTPPFLLPGEERLVNHTLMPDGMHAVGAGGQLLAECVLGALQRALSGDRGSGGGGGGASS